TPARPSSPTRPSSDLGHPPHRLGLLRRADPRPPRSGGHAAPGPALEAVGKHAGRAVTEPAMTTPPREEARRVSPITPVLNAWKRSEEHTSELQSRFEL